MHAFFAPLLGLFLFLTPDGGWLGVYLDGSEERAVITEVVPDSPASKAGLRAGDVLLAVGDKATPTRDGLIAAIGAASPGDRVSLKVERGGRSIVVVVKLGERPSETAVAETARPAPAGRGNRPARPAPESAAAPAAGGVFLGISVTETDGKLMIERVLDGSPAAAAGLKAGEQLAGIGRSRLRSLADLDEALGDLVAGKPVEVVLRGKDSRRSVLLTPAPRRGAAGTEGDAPASAGRAEARNEPRRAVRLVRPDRRAEVRGAEAKVEAERKAEAKAKAKETKAEAKAREGGGDVDKELEALRRELAKLKKELQELRKQIRRQGRGK